MAEPTLFDEASLALIASGGAGKDGKVYSIKPVPEYGPEKVTNVDFATDSDWSKTSGVTISGGKALLNIVGGAYTSLSQAFSYTSGRSYVLTAVVQGTSGSNGKQFRFQDRGNNTGGLTISNGTITLDESVQNIKIYWTANSNSDGLVISRASTGDWSFSIDNVSVKEVLVDAADFTFSRGSNLAATRVGADGLIEKGRENLFTYSNTFDNSAWTWNGGSATGGQTDRDGGTSAYLATRSSGGSVLGTRSVSLSGVYTFSIYVKINASNGIGLAFDNTAKIARFNISDENQTTAVVSTGLIDSTQEYIGNNFYRLTISGNTTATQVRLYMLDSTGTNNDSGGGSQIIQDAQLDIGLAATDYIESGATTGKAGLLEDEPRFDYSGGATCPSLLLEPSRTNLMFQSEYFGSGWNFISTDYESNATASPEGLINSTKVFANTSSAIHYFERQGFTGFTSGDYTYSFFAKSAGSDFVQIATSTGFDSRYQNFNLATGEKASGDTDLVGYDTSITAIGDDGWYRLTVTANASSTSVRFLIVPILTDTGRNPTFAGDGSTGVYIYGVQLEASSYPTSYIPNHSGGTITRGADVCGDAGDVNTFNSTEGVLYLEASALDNGSSEKGIALNDGGTNNRINIRILNNNIRAYGIVGGSLVCLMTYAAPSVTSINKIAFKYKENDFALWVNGVERVTDNSGAIFPANTLNELSFDYGGASAFFYGKVKQVLVFKEALSDTELVKLTTI